MSIITYGELFFGVQKSLHPKKNKRIVDELSLLIPPLPMPCDAAFHYGELRSKLGKQRKIIGNNDLLIAALALTESLILVTNNTKEFARITHLKIENWGN